MWWPSSPGAKSGGALSACVRALSPAGKIYNDRLARILPGMSEDDDFEDDDEFEEDLDDDIEDEGEE